MASSSSSSSSKKTIKKPQLYLRSYDGGIIKSEGTLEAESGFIRSHLHNNNNSNTISVAKANGEVDLILPLPNVDSLTLDFVRQYCRNRHNSNAESDQDTLNALDSDFLTNHVHTRQLLRSLIFAAESLEIDSLLNSTRNRIEEQDSQIRNMNRIILERLRRESPH